MKGEGIMTSLNLTRILSILGVVIGLSLFINAPCCPTSPNIWGGNYIGKYVSNGVSVDVKMEIEQCKEEVTATINYGDGSRDESGAGTVDEAYNFTLSAKSKERRGKWTESEWVGKGYDPDADGLIETILGTVIKREMMEDDAGNPVVASESVGAFTLTKVEEPKE